jgi:hypothetical protein
MSISTAKDYIEIFALIFKYYQVEFTEVGSRIDLTLLGGEEKVDLARFLPDIGTINDINHSIDFDHHSHISYALSR